MAWQSRYIKRLLLRAERYIFEKSEERFILLTQNNYKRYILPDGK